MIRMLIGIALAAVVLVATALYAAYGQVDPCRALAVERARRAQEPAGTVQGAALEPWTRLQTSQLSTGACASGLLDSWGARLSRHMR